MARHAVRELPQICPYVYYTDVGAALTWLIRAFGFEERGQEKAPDGTLVHAELALGGGVVLLGHPGPDYASPNWHGHVNGLVHVYVDDVDAHFVRARDAGAIILTEPADKPYGDRNYLAADLEGNHWGFAQRLQGLGEAV